MSPIVTAFFFLFQSNELFARAALHFLSTLTLRSKENSQALFEVGVAETIVDIMRLHPKSKIVQVFKIQCAHMETYIHEDIYF